MSVPSLVLGARRLAEAGDNAPEGLEFFDWWWVPYGSAAYIPLPIEHSFIGSSVPPPHLMDDVLTLRPRLWFWTTEPQQPEEFAVGWDAPTRNAAVFYRNGFGKLYKVTPPRSQVDALADEGAEQLAVQRQIDCRRMLHSLVCDLQVVMEKDGTWDEVERCRDMRARLESEPWYDQS